MAVVHHHQGVELVGQIADALQVTIELLTASTELRDRVHENTAYFRAKLSELGFDVLEGSLPIFTWQPAALAASSWARRSAMSLFL